MSKHLLAALALLAGGFAGSAQAQPVRVPCQLTVTAFVLDPAPSGGFTYSVRYMIATEGTSGRLTITASGFPAGTTVNPTTSAELRGPGGNLPLVIGNGTMMIPPGSVSLNSFGGSGPSVRGTCDAVRGTPGSNPRSPWG